MNKALKELLSWLWIIKRLFKSDRHLICTNKGFRVRNFKTKDIDDLIILLNHVKQREKEPINL